MMRILAPLRAVAGTMHRRICPLYSLDERERLYMLGSAISFKSGGISFLITATHVCQTRQSIALPLLTWGVNGLLPLTQPRLSWEYQPKHTPDLDVTLIALSDMEASEISGEYQFSDPSVAATIKEKTPGVHYMVTGYPTARNRIRLLGPKLSIPALATSLITGDIRSVVGFKLQDKYESEHFALHVRRGEIPGFDGPPFRVPKPQGMSGGGVWMFDIDTRTMLASTPQLVGIVIEYHNQTDIFVATRLQVVIPLVYDLRSLLRDQCPSDVLPAEPDRTKKH